MLIVIQYRRSRASEASAVKGEEFADIALRIQGETEGTKCNTLVSRRRRTGGWARPFALCVVFSTRATLWEQTQRAGKEKEGGTSESAEKGAKQSPRAMVF